MGVDLSKVDVFDEDGKEKSLNELVREAEISGLQKALEKEKIDEISDFGPDQKTAREEIKNFLDELGDDDKAKRKYRITLNLLWDKFKKGPPKKDKKEALPPPELMEGKAFDLSGPSIEVDGKDFKIPTKVSTSSNTKMADPFAFSILDWITLARRTGLTYGLNLDKAYSVHREDYQDAVARHPALVWFVPKNNVRFISLNLSSSMISTITYSERTNSTVHNRICGASLSVSTPFASANVEAEHENKSARAGGGSKLYMNGIWTQPMAQIDLVQCTRASVAFVNAVKEAVKADQTVQDAQGGSTPELAAFKKLEKVFADFGHVASRSVVLGGMMLMQTEKTVDSSATEDDEKLAIKAAVSAKVGSAGGGVSGSYQNAESKKSAAMDMAETSQWQCYGGDRTKVQDAMGWADTVKDVNSWDLVERQGLRPLVDWLNDDLRKEVDAKWKAGLAHIWGKHPPPVGALYPQFNNQPFYITTGNDYSSYALKSDHLNWKSSTIVDGDSEHLGSIKSEDLAGFEWTLIYSGMTTNSLEVKNGENAGHTGKPLFWIVSYRDAKQQSDMRFGKAVTMDKENQSWMLSTYNEIGKKFAEYIRLSSYSANFFQRVHQGNGDPEHDSLLWTVDKVAVGNLGEKNDNRYRVRSLTGLNLSSSYWAGKILLYKDEDYKDDFGPLLIEAT